MFELLEGWGTWKIFTEVLSESADVCEHQILFLHTHAGPLNSFHMSHSLSSWPIALTLCRGALALCFPRKFLGIYYYV